MSEKKVFLITKHYYDTKDIVAEDYESAVEKFEESPTKFGSIVPGSIEGEWRTRVEEEPPRNSDGDLICGRYVSAREHWKQVSRPCQNRVSEPFEPCHLHREEEVQDR